MLRVSKDIDVINNMSKQSVLVAKTKTFLYTFVIECNRKLFQMDVKLHIF